MNERGQPDVTARMPPVYARHGGRDLTLGRRRIGRRTPLSRPHERHGSSSGQPDDGKASVHVTAWANEGSGNRVTISGANGEVADLPGRFPHLDISGTYKGSYGSGDI